MAADRILGRDNPWRELFDAGRTKMQRRRVELRPARTRTTRTTWFAIASRAPRDARCAPSNAGEGKIIERNGQKVAAFRDDDGSVTMVSAVCTHMGCLVDWNKAERTWDCPCHGSRFKPDGAVIGGPAETPLPKITD